MVEEFENSEFELVGQGDEQAEDGQEDNGPLDEDGLEATDEGDELAGSELKFRVGANLRFRRLDKYLQGRFNQFSRTRLQKLIKEQGVNVNGRAAKASVKLNPGDEIDLILPPKEIREILPQDIPLDVIYEDEDIIVINKQADIIVHPARGHKTGTLVNALVYHVEKLSGGAGENRPGIVHRLDRNTTGVMVVAKNDTAQWKIARQFQNRTVKKYYLAVVHGSPELDGDCIDQPLGVHPRAREKFAIRPDIGKQAVTFYEVLERFRGYSLVKLDLKTGRTHQIRVHLSYIGHPIVADDMYGGKVVYPWQVRDEQPQVNEPIMARVALHAWTLELNHPMSGERMTFKAELPGDIGEFLDALRKYRKPG